MTAKDSIISTTASHPPFLPSALTPPSLITLNSHFPLLSISLTLPLPTSRSCSTCVLCCSASITLCARSASRSCWYYVTSHYVRWGSLAVVFCSIILCCITCARAASHSWRGCQDEGVRARVVRLQIHAAAHCTAYCTHNLFRTSHVSSEYLKVRI